MGCDACTDKEKQQYFQKLKADAKKQAQEEGAPVAICQGQPEGHFLCNAYEAARTGQTIVDVVFFVQQTEPG